MSSPPPPIPPKLASIGLVKPKAGLKRASKFQELKETTIRLIYQRVSDLSTRMRDAQFYVFLLEVIAEGWRDDPTISAAENKANRDRLTKEVILGLFPDAEAVWPEIEAILAFIEGNSLVEGVSCGRRVWKALGNCLPKGSA
jgi:hypothetical protein